MNRFLIFKIIKSLINFYLYKDYRTAASQKGGVKNTGRYCYSVWLRHLVKAHENGFNTFPNNVAEFGPGDSLGVGFAALLSGSKKYIAFDAQPSISTKNNLKIFEEVLDLFSKRADIPDENEFQRVKPFLKSYKFPKHILDDERLSSSLRKDKIKQIRDSISNTDDPNSIIQYRADFYNCDLENEFDMVLSQAVLEHVDDLKKTYEFIYQILKDYGFISNQIDFKSHSTAQSWDGHWKYSSLVWKIIRGNSNWLLNRMPFSNHLAFLEENNFKNIKTSRNLSDPTFCRDQLAKEFFLISELDRKTSGGFFQAMK